MRSACGAVLSNLLRPPHGVPSKKRSGKGASAGCRAVGGRPPCCHRRPMGPCWRRARARVHGAGLFARTSHPNSHVQEKMIRHRRWRRPRLACRVTRPCANGRVTACQWSGGSHTLLGTPRLSADGGRSVALFVGLTSPRCAPTEGRRSPQVAATAVNCPED